MRLADLKVRNPQTKTKHLILKHYAGAWGGIIAAGLGRRAAATGNRDILSPQFVFVDAFGGPGRYLRDSDQASRSVAEPVYGSPIIGIRALDELKRVAAEKHHLAITTTAIISEHDPQVHGRLDESLRLAGYDHRVRRTANLNMLKDGESAFLHKDFRTLADDVLAYVSSGFKYSLVFLDPYGPLAIPYEMVAKYIAGQRRDVILFFPYQRLLQTTGHIGKENSTSEALLANFSAMFGDGGKWMDVYREGGDVRSDIQPEEAVVEYYRRRLQDADPTLTIKSVGLLAPGQDRHLFYLFLTTHDPSGALVMNEVLDKAKLTEQVLRSRHAIAKRIEIDQKKGQMPLLELDDLAPENASQSAAPSFAIPEVAQVIHEEFAGATVDYRTVCRYLADTRLWPKHVKAAMQHLKKDKRVTYDRLTITAALKFAPKRP